METQQRLHYCSFCLHSVDAADDFCVNPSCGKTRPNSGWPHFYEPGENIDGRFRIRRRLGAGGAGVTYRAIDLVADDPDLRDVALKVLHQDRGQGILRDRLRLEGEVLQRLEHPHVVAYRDMKVDGSDPYYLATGFVPGGALDEPLRASGRLPARIVLVVGAQIARALAAAHAIGVTHRDLKPSNILVRSLDEYPLHVRVADWGIARAVPEFIPRRHVTLQGGFVGTPEFASPEQLRGESTVGPPTDIFGLGALMHSLAGGQPIRDLVARGAVDFHALREGASRYERVPLTVDASEETHLPLLDELVDQLITRSAEARPDAQTVAAYCEELLEAGDTAPKHGRPMAPLPALMPAAAFDTPKKDLLLPEDPGHVKPLRLSDEEPEKPPASTVEMEGKHAPAATDLPSAESLSDETPAPMSSPASVPETPWQGQDLVTPTAVPEEMESVPAMEILREPEGGAAAAATTPSAPVVLAGPVPEILPTENSLDAITPANDWDAWDDVPRPRRRRVGSWVAAVLVLVLVAVIVAIPEVRCRLSAALVALVGEHDHEATHAAGHDAADADAVAAAEDGSSLRVRRAGLWGGRPGGPGVFGVDYQPHRHGEFQQQPRLNSDTPLEALEESAPPSRAEILPAAEAPIAAPPAHEQPTAVEAIEQPVAAAVQPDDEQPDNRAVGRRGHLQGDVGPEPDQEDGLPARNRTSGGDMRKHHDTRPDEDDVEQPTAAPVDDENDGTEEHAENDEGAEEQDEGEDDTSAVRKRHNRSDGLQNISSPNR